MDYLLMSVSIGATVVNNSLRNKFGKGKLSNFADYCAFNSLTALAALAVLFFLGRGFGAFSFFTVALGLIFGAVITSELLLALKALSIGPMAYTNLFGLCGMIIPTFSGSLFWDETVKPVQYVGIALMLLSFVLGVNPKKDKKMTGKWIALCVLLFFADGSMGVIQKVHQTSAHKDELSACLITAFAFTALSLTVLGAVFNRFSQPKTVKLRSSIGGCAAACGVCMALIHHINIYLSGVMDSAFYFPVINGACIMGSILASVIIFKEKLTKLQVLSLALGVFAIMLLGNITDFLFK